MDIREINGLCHWGREDAAERMPGSLESVLSGEVFGRSDMGVSFFWRLTFIRLSFNEPKLPGIRCFLILAGHNFPRPQQP
jgi:hypothetical protein